MRVVSVTERFFSGVPQLPPPWRLSLRLFLSRRSEVCYSKSVSVEQIIGLTIALVIMGIGVAGRVLPGLPSTPLVLLSAILHKLYFGLAGVGWVVMSVLAALMALSLVMDYTASIYGARRLGATWRGATGAMVGGL